MKNLKLHLLMILVLSCVFSCSSSKTLTRVKAQHILSTKCTTLVATVYNSLLLYNMDVNVNPTPGILYNKMRNDGFIRVIQISSSGFLSYKVTPNTKLAMYIVNKHYWRNMYNSMEVDGYNVRIGMACVNNITGITMLNNTTAQVNYTIKITPTELWKYVKIIPSNWNPNVVRKATFRLFDDGWRCTDTLITNKN